MAAELLFTIMKPSLGGRVSRPLCVVLAAALLTGRVTGAEIRTNLLAGASTIDITPTNFPIIVNAMFEERTATNVKSDQITTQFPPNQLNRGSLSGASDSINLVVSVRRSHHFRTDH